VSAPLNKEFDTKSALFNFFDTWLEPARVYADVQYVMALRTMRLALGGARWKLTRLNSRGKRK
jgi:hypothetical protein